MKETAPPDPFDPPGVEWRHVEPRLAVVRLIGLAIGVGPLLLVGIVVSLIRPGLWTIGATAAVAVFAAISAWTIPRRVRATTYAVRDRDLFHRQGIMFRRMTVTPYVRIQYADINVGPVERAFGLASLTVSTAAPLLTTRLHGITPATAAELRDILTDRGKLTGAPAGPATESAESVTPPYPPPEPATGEAPPPPTPDPRTEP